MVTIALPHPPSPDWWIPNTDVYIAEDGHFVIEVELAAINKEDLELTVDANRLIIRGERTDGGRRSRCNFLVTELRYGRFESVVEVPSGYDAAQAGAEFRNGIFRIDVPLKRRRD